MMLLGVQLLRVHMFAYVLDCALRVVFLFTLFCSGTEQFAIFKISTCMYFRFGHSFI